MVFYKQGIYTYTEHTQNKAYALCWGQKSKQQRKYSTLKFEFVRKQKSWLIGAEQWSSVGSSRPLKATTLALGLARRKRHCVFSPIHGKL